MCRPLYVAFIKRETMADYVKAVETITGMGEDGRKRFVNGFFLALEDNQTCHGKKKARR